MSSLKTLTLFLTCPISVISSVSIYTLSPYLGSLESFDDKKKLYCAFVVFSLGTLQTFNGTWCKERFSCPFGESIFCLSFFDTSNLGYPRLIVGLSVSYEFSVLIYYLILGFEDKNFIISS